MAGERMLRIVGESLHPVAQLRDVNAEVLRRLRIGNAALLDQPNCLKLELTCELPTPLHGLPPAPLNTLTRCLRNRGQANLQACYFETVRVRIQLVAEARNS